MSVNFSQYKAVHIGELIQQVFEQKAIKLSDFAEQLGTVRQNVYRIFKKRHLDTGLLLRISQVLDHNFFQYYCQEETQDSLKDIQLTKLQEELTLASKEITYLKKIIALMEERAELVQQVEKEFTKTNKAVEA
ncbi:MAG: XRE family transcriptional regulator [Cytophagia bacterium]|nr:XRE family transcriptional regulator [Cytophagia bacterium]NBW34509.1 XRE family transcriptional regulator [Cytophagia bacterium]